MKYKADEIVIEDDDVYDGVYDDTAGSITGVLSKTGNFDTGTLSGSITDILPKPGNFVTDTLSGDIIW